MGLLDNLFGRKDSKTIDVFTPNVTTVGYDEIADLLITGMSPAELWRTQPHLRTVISFLARNVAQLGVHAFTRNGEDRARDRTSPLALLLDFPNSEETIYDLIYALVCDKALYDRAYWLVVPDDSASGWSIRRLPPTWVTPVAEDAFRVKKYRVRNDKGNVVELEPESVLAFGGYHPSDPRKGSSAVDALRETLSEQIQAAKYRNQTWKRGGRVSAVLQRPAGAPQWTPEQREAFREDWYSKYTGSGSHAGGTPILDDGMTLNRIDFSAADQQFVEASKLSFSTIASAFHVNPTMVGVLDNANYSNVREFRRMLYGDTLGPLLTEIERRLNTFLVPRIVPGQAAFVEFNIAEKLQGSFEEQARVMQTLVGAPIMTRNEGRAKFNLPSLADPEFDLPITPLNVLAGGQASPADSGSQNEGQDNETRTLSGDATTRRGLLHLSAPEEG